ncbi:hypothetical protein M1446_05115 [Candidatus Dependentiae bacterium]|nr:hypothetical protein [Candidatus Dependentiae bacterium]
MKLNKIIFLTITFLISFINAEYVVYKRQGENALPLTNQEYTKVFQILQIYQWPMVIGMANRISKQELDELTKPDYGEEKFLRKKIKQLSTEYDIFFVPTLFYELFAISGVNLSKDVSDYIDSFARDGINFDNTIVAYIQGPIKIQHIYDLFNQKNFQSENINKIINDSLLQFCESIFNKAFAIESTTGTFDIQTIIEEQIENLMKPLTKSNVWVLWNLRFLRNEIALKRILNLEFETHKKNVAILYRGGRTRDIYIIGTKKTEIPVESSFLATVRPRAQLLPTPVPTFAQLELEFKTKGKPSKMRDWNLPLNSVSYGNSIFGGAAYDSDRVGACACNYLDDPNLIGYALLINKEQFLSNKLNFLYIPPLNTLLSCLFANGEFFHARTKVFASDDYYRTHKNYIAVPGIKIQYAFIDNAHIFSLIGDPMEKAKELSEFIQTKATILKLPESEGGFNFKHENAQSYINAQKNLTDMLKTMITIRKYIGAKKEGQAEPMEIVPAKGKRKAEYGADIEKPLKKLGSEQ